VKKVKYFDLHCDTITELHKKIEPLKENSLHISLNRAGCFEAYTQVFAIFIPDTLRGKAAVDYFDEVCDYYEAQLSQNKDLIAAYQDTENRTSQRAILAVEGAAAAAGTTDGLHHLYNRGVRLITLTWNGDNELASGCFSENDTGFTPFGREFVKEMERLNMAVDVSHLSDKGFREVASFAEKPFIASHSCCRIVDNPYAQKRNLTDEQIKHIVSIGGIIGINFCTAFLGCDENDGFEAVYRHICHALNLGAEKTLSIGSDFDGCNVPANLDRIEKVPQLYSYLLSRGIDKALLDDIFFNNAERFFTKLLTD
jgi:membrane dipeptidase